MRPQYVIAELKEGEPGGFSPRGAVKRLWQSRDYETIVSGPAETGKTFGCLHYADALLWKYPGAQGVMARKVYSSLIGSAVQTYKRIIGINSPIKPFGGERPEWFQYPNGSRLWLAGLDNPGKALSSERDFIYVNQAEGLILADWETFTTRSTGRGAVMPYTRIFGDCNPEYPHHWIKVRQGEGKLLLLESSHQDNPTLYDDEGNITAQGKRTMSILGALSGVRKSRLLQGQWVQAEGTVYEEFSPAIHVIDKMPEGWRSWRKIRVIDFGYSNPFVCQWWAIDGDGRMYLYREIYKSRRIVEDHANGARDESGETSPGIKTLSRGETYEATIADHDAEDRATLSRHEIETVPAWKSITPGIGAVQARLRKSQDGRPRIFFLASALVERDELLAEARKPTDTVSEFGGYVYPKGKDGKPVKEDPIKVDDHGMDTTRYAVCYIDDVSTEIGNFDSGFYAM